ncbi:MAG: peptidoglycan-binding domain-containing protein, partial [Acidaminococcaceae bacterium]
MKKPFNMFLVCCVMLFYCSGVAFASSDIVAKRGMNEEIVGQIQAMLWEMKLYDGDIDQEFGPRTEQAVKNFQRKINKTQDGIV